MNQNSVRQIRLIGYVKALGEIGAVRTTKHGCPKQSTINCHLSKRPQIDCLPPLDDFMSSPYATKESGIASPATVSVHKRRSNEWTPVRNKLGSITSKNGISTSPSRNPIISGPRRSASTSSNTTLGKKAVLKESFNVLNERGWENRQKALPRVDRLPGQFPTRLEELAPFYPPHTQRYQKLLPPYSFYCTQCHQSIQVSCHPSKPCRPNSQRKQHRISFWVCAQVPVHPLPKSSKQTPENQQTDFGHQPPHHRPYRNLANFGPSWLGDAQHRLHHYQARFCQGKCLRCSYQPWQPGPLPTLTQAPSLTKFDSLQAVLSILLSRFISI